MERRVFADGVMWGLAGGFLGALLLLSAVYVVSMNDMARIVDAAGLVCPGK